MEGKGKGKKGGEEEVPGIKRRSGRMEKLELLPSVEGKRSFEVLNAYRNIFCFC